MSNREKLQALVVDTFLLDPAEFRLELKREQIDTWDSLGVVTLAVGVEQVFGYHLKPEEATGLKSVQDLVDVLQSKGIRFDD